jgi:hypothetical protein
MNSIDISDLAFSLSNYSAVNEMLNSSTETIPELVTETIPELVTETIPELVTETIPNILNTMTTTNIISDTSDIEIDTNNNFFLYLGVVLIIVTIIGFFTYNYYYKNKNKHVHFQDNVENIQHVEHPVSNHEYQNRYSYSGSEI